MATENEPGSLSPKSNYTTYALIAIGLIVLYELRGLVLWLIVLSAMIGGAYYIYQLYVVPKADAAEGQVAAETAGLDVQRKKIFCIIAGVLLLILWLGGHSKHAPAVVQSVVHKMTPKNNHEPK